MSTRSKRDGAWLALGLAFAVGNGCSVSEPNITIDPPGAGGDDGTAGDVGASGKGKGGTQANSGGSTGAEGGEAAAGGPASGGTTGGTTAGGTTATAGSGSLSVIPSDGGVSGAPDGGTGGEPPLVIPNPCDGSDAVGCVNVIAAQPGNFGSALKSSWFLQGCQNKQGHDCIAVSVCPNQAATDFEDSGARTVETFPVAGKSGQNYKLTFKFNAVASAKEYSGGTRDAGATVPVDVEASQSDSFYRDGAPIPSNYDVWKLTVFDAAGIAKRHYYMNSFPSGSGYESHRQFLLSYSKSVVVVGGGKIEFLVQDRNCHVIDNCGAGNVSDTFCPAPRYVPNEPSNTPLPALYPDPATGMATTPLALNLAYNSGVQPWHAALGHFTVTAASETAQPVTYNFP